MANKSRYFSARELACPCCNKVGMEDSFLDRADKLREGLGRPLILHSAYRCEKHNADPKVGGKKGSYHPKGRAMDIQAFTAAEKHELVAAGIRYGFRGIGIGKTFVHLDDREEGAVWTY